MRYLSLADTEWLDLRMRDVVPAVEAALRLVGEGRSVVAPRVRLVHPPLPPGDEGLGRPWDRNVRIIPGGVEGLGIGVRVGAGIRTADPPRHRGAGVILLLFDWETMALQALISDHLVHAIRSTAPDGVLAKYLAREDAHTLGLIGAGRLARWAAEAVCAVRPIRELRVWSPTAAHREECARYLEGRAAGEFRARAVDSAESAVREAEVVVTATTARDPVLDGAWLAPGTTVLTNRPEELDRETVRRGRIVTTYWEGVWGHVPPYQALRELRDEGALGPEALGAELADIVVGRAPGRQHADEIIVCLNPAYGVLDAATAAYVYQRAVEAGVGTELSV